MARPIASASKSTRVYQQIRERIIDGRYTPGFRLTLSMLAAEFGVSTVPVREAIRWLEAEGLIEYKHNVGAQVSHVDISSYTESMETLAYLEGTVTALSAPHLTEADLQEAERINIEMDLVARASTFDSNSYRRLNGHFHTLLCSACPNQRVLNLMTSEAERVTLIRRSALQFNAQRSLTSIEQHAQLIAMIRKGADQREIELFAREHKKGSLHRLLRVVDD